MWICWVDLTSPHFYSVFQLNGCLRDAPTPPPDVSVLSDRRMGAGLGSSETSKNGHVTGRGGPLTLVFVPISLSFQVAPAGVPPGLTVRTLGLGSIRPTFIRLAFDTRAECFSLGTFRFL